MSRHAYSVLVTPPAEEPITLAEAKLRAGLDWPSPDAARDQLMNDFIAAARSKVEHDTGLALLAQTRDLFYDGTPLTDSILVIAGQCRPLQSVIAIDPIAPTPTHPIVLPPLPASALPPLTPGAAVVIRLIAGFPDVAALRTAAPLLVHAVGLLTAHYATLGRDLASIDTLAETPHGYCEAIGPYVPVLI